MMSSKVTRRPAISVYALYCVLYVNLRVLTWRVVATVAIPPFLSPSAASNYCFLESFSFLSVLGTSAAIQVKMSDAPSVSPSRDQGPAANEQLSSMTAKITAPTVETNANKDTQTRIFDISATYASEILEFWVYKHHTAKAEADSLKV